MRIVFGSVIFEAFVQSVGGSMSMHGAWVVLCQMVSGCAASTPQRVFINVKCFNGSLNGCFFEAQKWLIYVVSFVF